MLFRVCGSVKISQGCWNMMEVNFFTSSMNTFLDIVIFFLPVPIMLKLQISSKKKSRS